MKILINLFIKRGANNDKIKNTEIVKNVIDLLENAREKVGTTINQTMVLTYFELGRMIVEEEKKVKIELNMGRKF